MSIRAWYECYVVDDDTERVSLAMQFFKWGDATPGGALVELSRLRAATEKLGGTAPVHLVRELLEDNLGEAYHELPRTFPLGCYYFIVHRAAEEVHHPFRDLEYARVPREDNPFYQLGVAVGRAKAETGYTSPRYGDMVLARAHFSIAVGMLVRRWSAWASQISLLQWLQYITQVTDEVEMGAIAESRERPSVIDINYLYRLFFRVPTLATDEQPIDSIDLEICDRYGRQLPDVLLTEAERNDEERDYLWKEYEELRAAFDKHGYEPLLLDDITRTHSVSRPLFWGK